MPVTIECSSKVRVRTSSTDWYDRKFMADKNPLTPEEVTELFSEIDASGVLDPTLAKKLSLIHI